MAVQESKALLEEHAWLDSLLGIILGIYFTWER